MLAIAISRYLYLVQLTQLLFEVLYDIALIELTPVQLHGWNKCHLNTFKLFTLKIIYFFMFWL